MNKRTKRLLLRLVDLMQRKGAYEGLPKLRKEFSIGTWGDKTACGTQACIAGHAALDPYFRRQGLIGAWDDIGHLFIKCRGSMRPTFSTVFNDDHVNDFF